MPSPPGRLPLLIDQVGYIPFESEAANLFIQLIPARYGVRRLGGVKPFATLFGDNVQEAVDLLGALYSDGPPYGHPAYVGDLYVSPARA
jgi:hypothetical protein